MEHSQIQSSPPSPDWLIRPFERSPLAPGWLGLGVALAWMGAVFAAHFGARALIGPAELPFELTRFIWTLAVNAALLGVILAGQAHLYLGAQSDLRGLRPLLPDDEGEFQQLLVDVPNLSTATRWVLAILGVAGGVAVATLDPTLREIHGHLSVADPRYLMFLLQNVLFGAFGTRLFATEIHLTRAYARLGERVEIDLFDQSLLLIFARKGLRSVVVWVLVSTAFSMFWVLDSAGQANILLPFGVLILVSVALIAPTSGVHRRIVASKNAELTRVTNAIREERAASLAPRRPDAAAEDARLSNLIHYSEFVKSIREWPIDLSIVARSLLLLVLGAGSWLGGAVVERLLGLVLD